MVSETTHRADAIIVGAGPAGSTAAATLARRGWKVVLADRAAFPRDKTCGDALTPRAIPVLERLGVLAELTSGEHQVVRGARLIAPNGTRWHLRFADHDLGLPPFGLVIARYELDRVLCEHAVAAGAHFLPGFRATGALRDRKVVVGVEGQVDGQTASLIAPITILATGASVGLLRAFGLLQTLPPGINAIRGYFSGVPDLSDELEFYFDPALAPGYAWVFPMAGNRANIGLGVLARGRGSREAPNLHRCMDEFLVRHARLQGIRRDGPLKGYPLRIDFPSCRPAGPGFLLAGEAAGLVNPVTGEGIDLALESGELAAQAADTALRQDGAAGRRLAPYARTLHARYASQFRGTRLLLRLATGPRAIDILIHQALRKPRLARVIAGINVGTVSPYAAFSPRVWWDILT
jgi:geranylgeranyl reductase family protein